MNIKSWIAGAIMVMTFSSFTTYQPKKVMVDACSVYGKIKLVESGEDVKVRLVTSGEKLRVRYVSSANKVGQWELVVSGAQYKVKMVESGEDFTIREVNTGEGCN